jgi:hypothetical protein
MEGKRQRVREVSGMKRRSVTQIGGRKEVSVYEAERANGKGMCMSLVDERRNEAARTRTQKKEIMSNVNVQCVNNEFEYLITTRTERTKRNRVGTQ